MKNLDLVALLLVIVGAINWGLVGIARFDLVTTLLGNNIFSSIVFAVVGLAGLYLVLQARAMPQRWAMVRV